MVCLFRRRVNLFHFFYVNDWPILLLSVEIRETQVMLIEEDMLVGHYRGLVAFYRMIFKKDRIKT